MGTNWGTVGADAATGASLGTSLDPILGPLGTAGGAALGALWGWGSQQFGPSTPAIDPSTLPNLQPGMTAGLGGYTSGLAGQQSLAQMLMAQANGQGPNPALSMLNQQRAVNNATAASAVGSVRGLNVGLGARQVLDEQAGNNQSAANAAATLRAQQELAATSQLGGLYGNMAGTGASLYTGAGGTATSGQVGAAGVNAGLTESQNAANAALAGGALSGGAAALVKNATGNANNGGTITPLGSTNGVQPIDPSTGDPIQPGNWQGGLIKMADGGMVPTCGYAEGGKVAHKHGPACFKGGGKVPGTAKVAGDSPSNDTVSAKLSPGEIVIPRSITEHALAPLLAAVFVKHTLAKNKAEVHPEKESALMAALALHEQSMKKKAA